jgi:hypothetical protein
VIHVQECLASLCETYQERGVAVVGFNSHDVDNYPQDRPEMMKLQKSEVGFTFPYLFDETQEVAKAYRAACTPIWPAGLRSIPSDRASAAISSGSRATSRDRL